LRERHMKSQIFIILDMTRILEISNSVKSGFLRDPHDSIEVEVLRYPQTQ